jgi:hypothetical protein
MDQVFVFVGQHPLYFVGAIMALSTFPLPTLVAIQRRHISTKAIVVLNLLFWWVPFCWLISLIWSLAGPGARSFASASGKFTENVAVTGDRTPL